MSVQRLLEQARRESVRRKLVPGRIFHHQMVFGTPVRRTHPKFVVYLGNFLGKAQVLVINSKPAPFVQAQPHLMDDQVKIDQKSHDFLEYDSYVDCHQLEELSPLEIDNSLIQQPDNLKCCLSEAVKADVIEKVGKSVNLPPVIKHFIIDALRG